MKYFVSLTILILSFQAVAQSKLTIKSQPPGADIYIASANSKAIKIGTTPYETDLNEIVSNYVKANSFVLELKKSGHNPYRLLVAKTAEADLELTANLELDEAISNLKDHDLLMNELFNVQKLVRGRNFTDALKQLDSLEKKHPQLSIIPEMKATTYYMNRDIENALSYYRKAFALNPDNADAYRMKTYLEKKLNLNTEVQ